jgi:carbon monoxide dehydrogenase subunit G
MELEHSFTVPVPRERAWEVLLDVERVAPCMPGASLDSVDGDAIKGRIKVKVGPIAMTYAGTARFTERDAEAGVVTLEASGKETRGSGTASASVRSVLEDQGEQTRVTVHTNLNVTGKPAQFGRGVMSEVSGRLIGIFAANLAEMLSTMPAPDGAAKDMEQAADSPTGSADSAAGSADSAAGSADAAAADDPEGALALPIEELHLPLRSYNSLRREGVHTVGELVSRTPQDLLAMENIGRASVEEIRQKLAERGLALGESAATANGLGSAPAADSPAAGTPAAESPAAAAPAAEAARPAWVRPAAGRADDDDALNLLSVAGLPVLKRAIPVLAALVSAVLVALGLRRRRRRKLG